MGARMADNTDDSEHVIAANEGTAVGLAAGHHFATGEIPVVYLQVSLDGTHSKGSRE